MPSARGFRAQWALFAITLLSSSLLPSAIPLSILQHSRVMNRIQQEMDGSALSQRLHPHRKKSVAVSNGTSALALQQHLVQGIGDTLTDLSKKLADALTSNGSTAGTKTESVSDVTGVSVNGWGDFSAVTYAALFGSSLALGVMLLFSILRKYNPIVYARDEAESARPRRFLEWITQSKSAEVADVVEAAGLDGWLFLSFYDLNRRIATAIGPPLVLILMPLNFYASSAYVATHPDEVGLLSRFDITYVPDGSNVLWVHAICIWYVILVSTRCMLSAHQEFAGLRYTWINSLPHPRATTVMVESIPLEFRSDKALKQYFENIFGEEKIERAYITRKIPGLVGKCEHLVKMQYDLNCAEAKYVEDHKEDKGGIIALAQAAREKARTEVQNEQTAVENGVERQSHRVCSGAGFVTFKSVFWARLATQQWYRQHVHELIVSMPPDPNDVIWADLAKPPGGSRSSELCGKLALVLIFLVWTPIVVFISGFTTLDSLQAYLPKLAALCDANPNVSSLLQGVLSSLALRIFLALLPTILYGIITKFFVLKAGAWSQYHYQRTYFTFLIIFVLLVTAIGRSLVVTVVGVINSPTSVIDLIASSLPGASHFYVQYLILGWSTVTFELVRSSNLMKYWWYRLTTSLAIGKCKLYCEPEDEAYYGLGSRTANATLYSTITFVFCICTPIITFAAWLLFCISRLVYGYLLVFVERKKPDLGGVLWVESLRQVFFGLFLFVVLMFGVLVSKAEATNEGYSFRDFGPSFVAFTALIPLSMSWGRFNDFAWEQLPLEEVARVSKERLADTAGPRCGEYVQPHCGDVDKFMFTSGVDVALSRAQAALVC